MRISDWSSDVCSSDLLLAGCAAAASNHAGPRRGHAGCAECGRHSCRWRQVMVAADIFRPFPPRALAWLRQRPAVSTELLALLASVFFTVACNYELWHTLVADIQAGRKHTRLNSRPSCAPRLPSS